MRCNPNPHGVSVGDTAMGIPDALGDRTLDRLIRREGYCILYTHLGKSLRSPDLLDDRTRSAFENLARRQQAGEVRVLTTRRLLDYHTMVDTIRVDARPDAVDIHSRGCNVDGLTLYDVPDRAQIRVDGALRAVVRNPPDHTGRRSCSIPLPRIDYPL